MKVMNEATPGHPSAGEGPVPAGNEALELMRLLWAMEHQLNSTSKLMAARLGLTGPQRLVVRIVGLFPGITLGRLAHILHVHPSTLSGIMKRLEKQGHVERKSDPADMRKALFHLTPTGRGLDVPAPGTVEDAVQRALRRLSEVQLEAARELLTTLAEELLVGEALEQPRRA